MRKSIRWKVNRLIILSIAILTIVTVATNLVIISRYTRKDSEAMMENTCSAKVMELNKQFQLVEQSVQNIYDISEALRPAAEKLHSATKTEYFVREFKETAITIANNTESAIAVYYRINPDLNTNGRQGFFYVKSEETGQFEPHEITDILAYDVYDVEHVGWYYLPVREGKPLWTEPYYNANIDVEMISYVVPIYDGDTLVGVVGMDVNFDMLKEIAEDISIYRQSGAVLVSMTNSRNYYNKCDVFGKNIPNDLYTIMQNEDESQTLLSYKINGDRYRIYYETLRNRMKIIVYALESNIIEQAYISIFASAVILAVSIFFTFMIAMSMTKKIMVPIESISEAAKQYAQGNWDAKVYCDTDDELKVLTDNITTMADKTKQYIDYINDMAKKDGLTGVRNKTAYMLYVERINTEHVKNHRQYAIIVFDVNNLKKVNDTYGHEKGDELIVSASKFICNIFAHSPVFRIGGDEFVAILDSDDYQKRNELYEEFKKYMRIISQGDNIFDVCIACGMAVFGEDGETYSDLFDVADQRMYQNKELLKGGTD